MISQILLTAGLIGGLTLSSVAVVINPVIAETTIASSAQIQAETYYRQGVLQYEKGHLEAAIALYSEAIRLNPALAVAYSARAGALGNQENYDAAIADYNAAIALDDELAAAYGGRGLARALKGELTPGVQDLWTAAQLFRQQEQLEQYFKTLSIIQKIAP
ncbi:MAG: tetratricopeptide repeat protein [Leptolyngbyaceae cyanobacterium]